jgi:hypothetical protein
MDKPKNGLGRYHELQAEAKKLGISASGSAEQLEAAIEAKKVTGVKKPGLTPQAAAEFETRMRQEFEIQEKIRAERQAQTERASIMAESEVLKIDVVLPEKPTELQLARARQLLGIKKLEVKPSPETLAIEKSKRGYYIFTNIEQDDAAHTIATGGKYIIHLIPGQVHVLSEFHIRFFRQKAVTPVYSRVPTGSTVEGQMGEQCKRTGSKPRFAFDHLGEAPDDAPFGMVTDMEILDKVTPKEEVLI